MRHLLAVLCALSCWGGAAAGAGLTVKIAVAPGLKFSPSRFAAAPGDHVRVELSNGDEMIHNFVITAPGERLKVVSAALSLGADGPARNFVPPLPEVLWSTRALNPGETTVLEFVAPSTEGVYPYVCTFPGHGFVMFGAMYVTRGELPPLASDHNIPPPPAATAQSHSGLLVVEDQPVVCRTFLPDCGPAAIAVGLPGGQSYCFDAAQCRLRYVWKGGFVDNTEQWEGKGDLWSRVVGRVYYHSPFDSATQRIGVEAASPPLVSNADAVAASYPSEKTAEWVGAAAAPAGGESGGDAASTPRWRGYQLIDGHPEFHYTISGADVRELIRPTPTGLRLNFQVTGAAGNVRYVTGSGGGASFSSSAGHWSAGTLTLTAAEAQSFTIDLTERPQIEPLGYWSMNDDFWSSRTEPPPGVVGAAFRPGGGEDPPHPLDAEIKPSQLAHGGTLIGWVTADPGDGVAPVFSCGPSWVLGAPLRDGHWHHLAWVFEPGQSGHLYVDGADRENAGPRLTTADDDFVIGSAGDRFLSGLLDEVRIYDRVVPASEIAALYRREASAGHLISP